MNQRIQIPMNELNFQFSRSQGPGGQNVNKVNSRATLFWDIEKTDALPSDVRDRFRRRYRRRISKEGVFQLSSQRYRDQSRNVSDCLDRLRELLLQVADAPAHRKKTRPTKGSQQRRLNEKKRRSETKALRRRPARDD